MKRSHSVSPSPSPSHDQLSNTKRARLDTPYKSEDSPTTDLRFQEVSDSVYEDSTEADSDSSTDGYDTDTSAFEGSTPVRGYLRPISESFVPGYSVTVPAFLSGYIISPELRVMSLAVFVTMFRQPNGSVWISVTGSGMPLLVVPAKHGTVVEDLAEWTVQAHYREGVRIKNRHPNTHIRLAFETEHFRVFQSAMEGCFASVVPPDDMVF